MGQDRRLPMDLESGLFRMLDEALAAYLAAAPDRVTLVLDWADQLEARVRATRAVVEPPRSSDADAPAPEPGKELPPALAAMFEERKEDERQAAEAAVRESIVELPVAKWREIQGRASSIGVTAELLLDGSELRLRGRHPGGRAATGGMKAVRRVHDGREGQGLVEYGLMTALTSALTLLWLVVFGGTLSDALTAIGQAIDQATGG